MIAWMMYCVLIGLLLVGSALAGESIARLVGKPARWSWAAALVLTVALAALAPVRRPAPTPASGESQATPSSLEQFAWRSELAAASRAVPSSAAFYVGGAWIVVSATLLALMLGVQLRWRRARGTWPLTDLHGTRVRVSPETGPVVIGFNAPEIVVPRWLLDRGADEQRLVVAHEAEHVSARDTLLLAGGCVACALMPWNPAVWFAFSRLRLAVELDCDARVLRGGVAAQSYGALLIDVAEHASALKFGAAALANSPSHLHRRIHAMKRHVPKFARMRGTVVALFGAGALLAACEAKMPTAAEVDRMDVASAEKRLLLGGPDSAAVYIVDGKVVGRIQALELKADNVAAVSVVKDGGVAKLLITTKANERLAVEGKLVPRRMATAEEDAKTNAIPLLFIDGVRGEPGGLAKLDRSKIESVEILKGSAALAKYGDEAKNGVVVVVTKK